MSNSPAASHGALKSEPNPVKRNTFSKFEKKHSSTGIAILKQQLGMGLTGSSIKVYIYIELWACYKVFFALATADGIKKNFF